MGRKGIFTLIGVLVIAGAIVAVVLANRDTTQNATDATPEATTQTTEQNTSDSQPAQNTTNLEIKDLAFSPADISVKKGTTVTWTNQDSTQHNIMSDDINGTPPTEDEVDATKLAGPLLSKGESYSFTFNELGVFSYHCSPHPSMIGTVTVTE